MNFLKAVWSKLAFWRRKEPGIPANDAVTECHRSFCSSPDFKEYCRVIWQRSGSGFLPVEAGFVINGDEFVMAPYTNENAKLSLQIKPGITTAIVHTHPNTSGPKPSTPNTSVNGVGDTGIGDRYKVDIYVVSSRGLWVYDWKTKRTICLYDSLDWLLT